MARKRRSQYKVGDRVRKCLRDMDGTFAQVSPRAGTVRKVTKCASGRYWFAVDWDRPVDDRFKRQHRAGRAIVPGFLCPADTKVGDRWGGSSR